MLPADATPKRVDREYPSRGPRGDAGHILGAVSKVISDPGAKETLPMIESEHDNLTPDKGRACPARTKEIRDVLLTGGEFKPNGLR